MNQDFTFRFSKFLTFFSTIVKTALSDSGTSREEDGALAGVLFSILADVGAVAALVVAVLEASDGMVDGFSLSVSLFRSRVLSLFRETICLATVLLTSGGLNDYNQLQPAI